MYIISKNTVLSISKIVFKLNTAWFKTVLHTTVFLIRVVTTFIDLVTLQPTVQTSAVLTNKLSGQALRHCKERSEKASNIQENC